MITDINVFELLVGVFSHAVVEGYISIKPDKVVLCLR
jgi:hypothetical protein